MKIYSFPPIVPASPKILILGTMPGVKSLEANQYYAHPQNLFWRLLFTLLEQDFSSDYSERKKLLVDHEIALWDVLKACRREGSLDSMIEQEEPNDLDVFLKAHPTIHTILFNGQKASQLFRKYFRTVQKTMFIMPSTSPAHTMKHSDKLDGWRLLVSLLEGHTKS